MIKVLEDIRHDKVSYSPGELIKKINIEDAERLVNLGVALFIEEFQTANEEDIDFKVKLDEKFNANDLKEVAEELEIEFPGNISKAKLIDLIMELDKAEEALKFEFIEEE